MPEFTRCHILAAGLVSTMFQGVACHLLQQDCEYEKQNMDIHLHPNPAYKVQWNGPLKVLHSICFTFMQIDQIQSSTLQSWLPEDLPYLLLVTAMLQTLITLRIAILRACCYGRTVLSVINLPNEPVWTAAVARHWKRTNIVKRDLSILTYLTREIARIRHVIDTAHADQRLPSFPLEPRYNHDEVVPFTHQAEELVKELEFHEVGYFDEEGQMVDTDVLLDPDQLGPRVPLIPMILDSDWASMEHTLHAMDRHGLMDIFQ